MKYMKKTVFSKRKYIELEGVSKYVANQTFVNTCDGLTGREILNLGLKVWPQYMEDLEIDDVTGEVKTESVAEEMFKALGYKRTTYNDSLIVYSDRGMWIYFNLNRKTVTADTDLTVDEFRAIDKQIEELGWL